MSVVTKRFQFGEHTVSLEIGRIAKQADAAVLVSMADTVVLVTAVSEKNSQPGRDFFPLTVNYQERTYAAGRIPGGFLKREGRPSEKETLTSRLIDRPLRPLFPDGFTNEVQVIATVMSLNPEVDADVPSMIGASAALCFAGLPFKGPLGAARVGYRNGQYLLNPSAAELAKSSLDLVVAGTENAVLMVESEANELSEDIMLGAVMFGHREMQAVIRAINEMVAQGAGKPAWDWQAPPTDVGLVEAVKQAASEKIANAYRIADKLERQQAVANAKDDAVDALAATTEEKAGYAPDAVIAVLGQLEKDIVRSRILEQAPRIDGRDHKTVRPISVEVGILPRVHGSALFTRGETQALVTVTLGTERDAQIIDAIEGEHREPFMLHYNFPPYCVGETGQVGSPKRREIGHGRLAKRGIQAVMPDLKNFPYVIRVVSEITESNGSSSMASVCGTSLALMDAGVPIRRAVAGIAMGLVKDDAQYAVLSDIMGDEDHLGDMDFKVAGTSEGVNALQMDIKIDGITEEIMRIALAQAKEGRMHILGEMNKVIEAVRTEMSQFAPRYITMKIHPDKIRDVIGKGGVTIRGITEETGATIDIDDDGTIRVASTDKAAGEAARAKIEEITADMEVGRVYRGTVTKITDFGAFVNILPGKEGLVHISQICEERVAKVSDKLTEGDRIQVKVLEVDRQGRIRLSMKGVAQG